MPVKSQKKFFKEKSFYLLYRKAALVAVWALMPEKHLVSHSGLKRHFLPFLAVFALNDFFAFHKHLDKDNVYN
jgi:hypothetical protein